MAEQGQRRPSVCAPSRSPLVTIITPSFNQGRFIRETIESVLGQDYPALEYIVMDGGSTDETESVVKEYAAQLTWIAEPDRGQSHAINKGLKLAEGEYVGWLNSDDVLLPGAIARVVEAFEADPALGFVYGDGYQIDADGHRFHHVQLPEPNLWALTYLHDYVLQPSAFWRTELHDVVGYVDESLEWSMDYDLFIRLTQHARSAHLPHDLSCQRYYPECKSAAGGVARFNEIISVVRRHSERKFPPAYWFYAWDTLKKITDAEAVADASRPKRIAAGAARLATTAAAPAVERTMLGASGLYQDRWAGRRLHALLHADGDDSVRIAGHLPDLPLWRSQRLRVVVDGREVGTYDLIPGDFELVVPLRSKRSGNVEVTIAATRAIRPALLGQSRDLRKLSFLLYELAMARRSEQPPSIYGWYADEWAAPVLRFEVPRKADALEVHGSLPEYPWLADQRIEVRANGAPGGTHAIGPGPFMFRVPVAGDTDSVDVELVARRSFVPKRRREFGDDPRRIAYYLHSIGWAGGETIFETPSDAGRTSN